MLIYNTTNSQVQFYNGNWITIGTVGAGTGAVLNAAGAPVAAWATTAITTSTHDGRYLPQDHRLMEHHRGARRQSSGDR